MEQLAPPHLTLAADEVPVALSEWLAAAGGPLLVSLERVADGRVVLQALPEVEPTVVAKVRKMMAQHADVLRRLS